MAWFTYFGSTTLHMDKPLFGDLLNDQYFGRATFKSLTTATIDFRYGGSLTDYVLRGAFTVGTSEIYSGNVTSVTSATSNIVNWTLTGLSGVGVLDLLDRATHLDPVGDFGTNIGANGYLLAGNDRVDDQSAGGNYLSGYAGNDTLLGNAGADTLEGGNGIDAMFGGDGDDTYVVNDVSDSVSEFLNGIATTGSDKIQSSATYTLPENVENLTLTGTGSINGFGNGLGNTIVGNAANNDLRGRAGNDSLNGGAGDDTLEGAAGNDTLNGGSGSDTASYLHNSKGINVAVVTTEQTLAGAGKDTFVAIENLIGSQYDDTLTGNGSANVLEGARGNDLISGGGGNDTASYAHAKSAVTVSLAAVGAQSTGTTEGTDTLQNIENLTGGTFNDSMTGDGNDNILNGGTGNDTLAGGLGADQFVFDNTSSTDTISDFVPGTDQIVLLAAFLPIDADSPGVVLPDEFRAGAGFTTAATTEQHLIYNTTNGDLYYDQDGSGFNFGTFKIATLSGAPALAASDIVAG
jgi:Ca2+-binding RTX toxin-like protein